jgi:hypothetical protein
MFTGTHQHVQREVLPNEGERGGDVLVAGVQLQHLWNIQGTFREHSSIQGTLKELSVRAEHSRNIQGTFGSCSVNIQEIISQPFYEHSKNTWGTFREYLGNIWGTFGDILTNVWGILREQ